MKKLAGIWDVGRSAGSIGMLLILLEELEIQRQVHHADAVEVIIVGDAKYLLDASLCDRADAPNGLGLPDSAKLSPAMSVLKAMSGVAACHVCADRMALRDTASLLDGDCVPWPDPGMLVQGGYTYDSTQIVQSYFARTGSIPRLSVTAELLAWARAYLLEKSRGGLSVAVHLKNNPAAPGQSNADLGSWLAFFSNCANRHDAHFFLVGDDATNDNFRSLPNVTIARNDGVRLNGYLALMQAAGLFMGMMSGPANMALFGKTPYVIFKNPDHHAREMAVELGDADRYPFALDNQRVLRVWDTTENLSNAFERATREMEFC
jgi:hypothetical protein